MNFKKNTTFYLSSFSLFVCYFFYAIWSYSQTDPNLVISSHPSFWSFQRSIWNVPDQLITKWYIGIVTVALFSYGGLVFSSLSIQLSLKKILLILLLVTCPLFLSNNALSHDVFNYMFNALMVVKYGADPHVKVALDFAFEPWTRFMHNTHTSAPYYYGWTAMSVVPYVLGFQKFLLTWLLFRAWSAFGFFLTLVFVWKLMPDHTGKKLRDFCVLAFSPLFAIELISNAHNDGWLMWPAFASLYVVSQAKKGTTVSLVKVVLSILLLAISISTKYVTVLFLPIWLFVLVMQFDFWPVLMKRVKNSVTTFALKHTSLADFSALLHLLPLVHPRSQYFHPWYLTWSMSFYPLMKNNFMKFCVVVLSISSLYRYVPWLWYGGFNYTPEIEMNERLITWVPLVIGIPCYVMLKAFFKKKS